MDFSFNMIKIRKITLITLSIIFIFFLFKMFYDDHVLEEKVTAVCELINLGDAYDDVMQIISVAVKNEGSAYVSEYTDGIYTYIYSNYPVDSIFYPQQYVCTAKFSDSIVIDKFVKFID